MTAYHTPVLLTETLSLLLTVRDGLYVDGTLGGGGHTQALLERLAGGKVIGFDRDPEAIDEASKRLRGFGEAFRTVCAPFGEMKARLAAQGVARVNGVLLDLGVSSHHLDAPERGFSFQEPGPLDMRMDTRSGTTADTVLNTYDERRLQSVFREYGEERNASRIARSVINARPLRTTRDFADAVRRVAKGPEATKSLARVFQAVRIEVNGELEQLHAVLRDIPDILHPGGRIVVLTYHSLEDRIVKECFRSNAATREAGVSRFLPEKPKVPVLKIVTKKPLTASETESAANPRARSAKLRAAERLDIG